MIRFFSSILLVLIGCLAFGQQPISTLKRHELYGMAQGTSFTISYYHEQDVISKSEIDSIFQVIDASMSLYQKDSKIMVFNDSNTSSMTLDPHMYQVIKRSFQIHKESHGVFDVTVKPLVSLWGFGPEKNVALPDSATIRNTMKSVGMDKLKLSGKRLIKKVEGVQIDLNGIAQGYTVDVLHDYLLKKRIPAFIVEVGGEIRTHGLKPEQEPFKVLVQRPEMATEMEDYVIPLKNRSITTSGSYEKYRTVKDYRFSHHMDPKTGFPLKSSIISVTVIADKAMDADGYDNVFMAMKPMEAIAFANKKNKMDIYLIYLEDGEIKEAYSKGFEKYLRTK